MKKIISVFLSVIMVFALCSLFVFNAAAEMEIDAQGVHYELSEDQTYYKVFGFSGTETNIVIPHEINGVPVKEIGAYGFSGCALIETISIPSSVTTISEWAFSYCSSIESIEIPDSVVVLREKAFYGCLGLKDVNIPKSIQHLEMSVFGHCEALETIEIPVTIKSIGDYVFANCISLSSVNIPASVEIIGAYVFYECTGLKEVTIPDTVKSISADTFTGCINLEHIYCGAEELPENWHESWLGENSEEGVKCPAYIHWGCEELNTIIPPYGSGATDDEVDPDVPEKPSSKKGDINGNDKIDMTDYILLKRAYFGTYLFTDIQNQAGDINSNDKIDMTDYILLKRVYFGTYTIK